MAVVALWVSAGSPSPDEVSSRQAIVLGQNLQQDYLEVYHVHFEPHVATMEDFARVPGIPARQHPVAVIDASCGQCHRVAGPVPPGSTLPEDVFDRLGPVRVESAPPEGFTRLTDSQAREEYPIWSPDGSTILFERAESENRYNLWSMDADGGNRRQLTHHLVAGWAAWRPDGERVAYWAADSGDAGNVWLLDFVDGGARRLTDRHMTAWPQWSPDGEWIAYQAMDADGEWSLWLLHVETGVELDVTQPADHLPSRPIWSPGGGELLYQSLVGTRFELTRLVFPRDAEGAPDFAGVPRRVTVGTEYPIDLGAATQHPAWSPGDDRIAFVMYTRIVVPVGGLVLSYKTWTASTDGHLPQVLVPEATIADRSPTWRHDGSWLAQWSWDSEFAAGVWLVEAGGGQQVELTAELGGDALYPAWSPDGERIAFTSNREGSFDIWLADVATVLDGMSRNGGR